MDERDLVARELARDTITSYTAFVDRGLFDEAAALFAPDGILEVRGVGASVSCGPPEIRDYFASVARSLADTPVPGRMQHHVSSLDLVVVSNGVMNASCYFTVMTGCGVDHWGRYIDVLTVSGDRALFSRRVVRTDGMTPGGWAATRA